MQRSSSAAGSARRRARDSTSGNDSAGSEILTLDPATLDLSAEAAAAARRRSTRRAAIEDVGERIRTLFLGQDKVGAFLRATLGPTLLYAARVAPDIAYSIDDVDRAMRWGFGWELGPFEIWDAIGVREVLEAVGDPDAAAARRPSVLGAGRNRFRDGARAAGRRRTCRF